MKLIELVKRASKGYEQDFPESSLVEFVDKNGKPKNYPNGGCGDTLALFVVRELKDTYDPKASDKAQVEEAIRVIDAARVNLDNIVEELMNPTGEYISAEMRQAAEDALGNDMEDTAIENVLATYGTHRLSDLKKTLKEKEAIFEAAGGRGVELADEIDELRIAIAIRKHQ